jgi:hypothetical protein
VTLFIRRFFWVRLWYLLLGRFQSHADLLTHTGYARMLKISRCGSYVVSSLSFLRVAWGYRQSLVRYGACAQSDSKMGTDIVRSLTHADSPHRSNALHSDPRPACAYHAILLYRTIVLLYIVLNYWFTYEIILCGYYAFGPNRVREQIRVTLKTRFFVGF